MPLSAAEWLDRLAGEFGTEPASESELNDLLALAGVAAHTSERIAAPVSCWLAAKAGLPPAEALERTKRLARDLPAGEESPGPSRAG